jgi:AraC-like DNA-binding protein
VLTDRVRSPTDRQRLPLRARLGVQNAKVLSIIELMENNLSEPLSLLDIADKACRPVAAPDRAPVPQEMGRSPARYYLEIRLDRARHLLVQSSMPVVEVAVACGFVSASHFSKCYRELYGRSPQQERADRNGAVGAGADVGRSRHACRRGAGADNSDPAEPGKGGRFRSLAAAPAGACPAQAGGLLHRPALRLRQCGRVLRRHDPGIALAEPLTLGVALGLLAWQADRRVRRILRRDRMGFADMPANASRMHLIGVSLLCGIGFTMSLFIGLLAFADNIELQAEVKVGILLGSLIAAVAGSIVLLMAPKPGGPESRLD